MAVSVEKAPESQVPDRVTTGRGQRSQRCDNAAAHPQKEKARFGEEGPTPQLVHWGGAGHGEGSGTAPGAHPRRGCGGDRLRGRWTGRSAGGGGSYRSRAVGLCDGRTCGSATVFPRVESSSSIWVELRDRALSSGPGTSSREGSMGGGLPPPRRGEAGPE
eukprot:EG_transcript_13819